LGLIAPGFVHSQITTPALRGSRADGLNASAAALDLWAQDGCFVHQGCDDIGYSDTGSMGAGWYCTDGVYVDSNTAFDSCSIHPDCHVGAKWDGGKWTCNDANAGGDVFGITDSCYIHTGCDGGAGYSADNTASLGNGWYCLDGQYVDANTQFDKCAIHKQCGCDATWNGLVWVCGC